MARIAGVDLPNNKRVEIGLTYIYGIGLATAKKIISETGINPDTRVKDLSEIFDKNCCVVYGHERLGKSALLAAAKDERFTHVFANASGQSGAALSNGKTGESIKDITKTNPYFFCKKYIEENEQYLKECERIKEKRYKESAVLSAIIDGKRRVMRHRSN